VSFEVEPQRSGQEKLVDVILTLEFSIKDLEHGLPELLGCGLECEREGGEGFLFREVEREDREGDGLARRKGSRDSAVRHVGGKGGVVGGGEDVREESDEE